MLQGNAQSTLTVAWVSCFQEGNMYVLGIHNDVDAGVCLLKDGRLLDAVSEERFSRVKLHKGVPHKSLAYLLRKHGLALRDIDTVAYGWHNPQDYCRIYADKLARRVVKAMERDPESGFVITDRIQEENNRDGATLSEFQEWTKEQGLHREQIFYADHHTCHAFAAFAASPFEDAVIFTMDGRGDLKSASVSTGNRSTGVERHDYLLTFDSLGYLYGKITAYLGFKPHRHEGKITGLAAYGDPEKALPIMQQLIGFEDGEIVANLGRYKPFFSIKPWLAKELDAFSREDVSAAVQRHVEDLATAWIGHWLRKLGKKNVNVCLGGGLFANVRLNQKIAELPEVDNIFVFPNMGDGGLVMGSAIYADHSLAGRMGAPVPTMYLGPESAEQEIAASLEAIGGVNVERPADKPARVVDDLLAGKVVGYFDGRMEFGPRALGARSILYHTRDRSVNEWLNARMNRSEFMPFAPVSPQEKAGEAYVGWQENHVSARFMTRTYDCTEDFSARHKAVVHVDGTARPQVTSLELNGDYHRVVSQYCEATGELALINTSFNRHEEPIVCTPEDALGGFMAGVVDVLYLNGHRVERQ